MQEEEANSLEAGAGVKKLEKTEEEKDNMKPKKRDKPPPHDFLLPMIEKENGQMVVDEEFDSNKEIVYNPETDSYVNGKVYGESSFNNMPICYREAIEYVESSEDEVDEEDGKS